MAYSRYRRRRTTRRPGRRPARATRYRRKSGYYPRIKGRKPMTRRRILNVTSKKKQDNMAPVVTSPTGGNATPGPYGYSAFGGTPTVQAAMFVWCPTARDRIPFGDDVTSVATRNSDLCYMRGLKETILMQTNSAVPWRWRRVCFTAKGFYNFRSGAVDSFENSNGWTRLLTDQRPTSYGAAIRAAIFRGQEGVDWNDVMTAKLDSGRITVKYDVTRTINSGNQTGVLRTFKMWHPMNKNLLYGNDEQGDSETADLHSTLGRAGMGDFYVLDFLQAAGFALAGDSLSFNPEATLYWHEK
uniref:Capsid protein n=1 Tax=Genomoviridae sp. TaxID=2202565 RepID=A0A8F5RCX2_9VIRU|nr:MAG: capsid protein [Genomoviridae sp.]